MCVVLGPFFSVSNVWGLNNWNESGVIFAAVQRRRANTLLELMMVRITLYRITVLLYLFLLCVLVIFLFDYFFVVIATWSGLFF